MKFSQRIGKTPLTKKLQLETIDSELLNGLWNIVSISKLEALSDYRSFPSSDSDFDKFAQALWHNYFKLTIDSISDYKSSSIAYIKNYFFTSKWFEVYDLIEFLSKIQVPNTDNSEYPRAINKLLEREFSAYRFVKGKMIPISNKIEIQEIEETLQKVQTFTSLKGANIHLGNALEKLSDKKSPDYRNSIKESISAVETTCRVMTGENSLGKALSKLEKKGIIIDDQLKRGFDKIYAYTNNKESGIRHAIIGEHKNPDFYDAKYMLIACSSFINFLIGKATKIGLDFS